MTNMKTNLLLTVLALSLAVSAYLDRRTLHHSENAVKAETANAPLLAIPAEEIESIGVRDAHRCVILRAAEAPFTALLDGVTKTHILRRFPPPSSDLAPYGLAHPQRQLAVQRRGELEFQLVLTGDLNPVGDAVYAKFADSADVLLIGGYFLTTLDFALQSFPEAKNGASESASSSSLCLTAQTPRE
jgi:hypothetical protein